MKSLKIRGMLVDEIVNHFSINFTIKTTDCRKVRKGQLVLGVLRTILCLNLAIYFIA